MKLVNITKKMKKLILLLALLLINYSSAYYTEEPVVDFITVKSASDRFPVTGTEYRTSLTNGGEEDANPTDDELLNGFQPLKLRLDPGGTATFEFPASSSQIFAYIAPAKNGDDNPLQSYCDKGPLSVNVTSYDQKRESYALCFNAGTCSPDPCPVDLADIHSGVSGTENVSFALYTDPGSEFPSFIWEVDISSYYSPSKVFGTYMDSARVRIDATQDVPDFNTQISNVAIVGMRGVGKSTILSLLSGNDTMFEDGSGSTGTTTVGTDISPVIPALDWHHTLAQAIGRPLSMPSANWPLFFTDSEGMGVRPGDFDFLTSSLQAIISKALLWVDEAPVDTANILQAIGAYLDELENITFDSGEGGSGTYCPSARYGYFLIIINKLTDDISDEELEASLLYPVPGETELNVIRQRIYECFSEVTVVGCPREEVPDGETFGYAILSDRFKDELAIMANAITTTLDEPRTLSISGSQITYNSTDASPMIDYIVRQANLGSVDLTENPLLVQAEEEAANILEESAQTLTDILIDNCERLAHDYICSECACLFRNKQASIAAERAEAVLYEANRQSLHAFGEDISNQVQAYINSTVSPWLSNTKCYQNRTVVQWNNSYPLCDVSEMGDVLKAPGATIELQCEELLLCSDLVYDAASLTLSPAKIYIEESASVQNLSLGFDVSIRVEDIFPGSATSIHVPTLSSKGAELEYLGSTRGNCLVHDCGGVECTTCDVWEQYEDSSRSVLGPPVYVFTGSKAPSLTVYLADAEVHDQIITRRFRERFLGCSDNQCHIETEMEEFV